MIRFEHTLFALPFAYLGSILAAEGLPDSHTLFWITMAMVGARSGAMGLNRLMDYSLDAKNPRTANRHLPQGLLKIREVILFVLLSLLLFFFSASRLNSLTLLLSPVALILLTFYSYSKRLTLLTHLFLGLTLSCGPIGGYIAVKGAFSLTPFLVGAAVVFWVAGFDIIYALQDMEFDRREGLFSIPSSFGIDTSLLIVRIFHLLTFILLLGLGIYQGLGLFFFTGLFLVGLLLFAENRIISSKDLGKMDLVFFKINSLLSMILLLFTLMDFLLLY